MSILPLVPNLQDFFIADPKGQEPQGHTYNKGHGHKGHEGHGGHEGVYYWTENHVPVTISCF